MKRVLLALMLVLLAPAVKGEVDSTLKTIDAVLKIDDPDKLVYAIMKAENPQSNPYKIGDTALYYKAHGLLQIRQPYLDDVNRIVGKKIMTKMWGKPKLTLSDIKQDVNKAIWAMKIYLVHYGKQYERETGKKVTAQIYARIHNGGPQGYKKWATKEYWAKVQSNIKSYVAYNEYYIAKRFNI